jgi:hypothetical protein
MIFFPIFLDLEQVLYFFLFFTDIHKLCRDFNTPESIKESVEKRTGIQDILVLLNTFLKSIDNK